MTAPAIRFQLTACVLAVGALAGCASSYKVDSQVESFPLWKDTTPLPSSSSSSAPSAIPLGAPTSPQAFRFERLPSQASGRVIGFQAALEDWTAAELAKYGWRPASAEASAQWTVQVAAHSSQQTLHYNGTPWQLGGQVRLGIGVGLGHGSLFWNPGWWPSERTLSQHQVGLLIRDAQSGRIAFESQAIHENRWNATKGMWQAMLSSALQGFPNPAISQRRVTVDVQR